MIVVVVVWLRCLCCDGADRLVVLMVVLSLWWLCLLGAGVRSFL